MIDDLVGQVGGDLIDHIPLIFGEIDPHSYELVKGDDEKISHAQIVFANGLNLEHGASLRYKLDKHPSVVFLGEEIKGKLPDQSHAMKDVGYHFANLWFAGRKKNWPLATYYFNETRGHIQWLIRKSPMIRGQDGKDVDISGIFDGVDTSSLAAVKTAIEKQDSVQFAATYRTMLESCYACHKAVGRPYIRPTIPTAQVMPILNFDPNATWPQ